MRTNTVVIALAAAALVAAGNTGGAQSSGLGLEVLVGGEARPEYLARGTTYVEALRGREYTLRVTNPLPVRVAVALAVDGLNTINASHGDARSAAKWVLDPHETIEISGWQVNGQEARAFFFTGERSSYGTWLGQTDNLGVIEAVFFRERPRPVPIHEWNRSDGAAKGQAAPSADARSRSATAESVALADEYAATGIGERRRHDVVEVHLDLEHEPAASVRLRYEFRPQLEKLGVLLPRPRHRSPLDRREDAHGFERDFCPEPGFGRR